jgi:hypothetical protein
MRWVPKAIGTATNEEQSQGVQVLETLLNENGQAGPAIAPMTETHQDIVTQMATSNDSILV